MNLRQSEYCRTIGEFTHVFFLKLIIISIRPAMQQTKLEKYYSHLSNTCKQIEAEVLNSKEFADIEKILNYVSLQMSQN